MAIAAKPMQARELLKGLGRSEGLVFGLPVLVIPFFIPLSLVMVVYGLLGIANIRFTGFEEVRCFFYEREILVYESRGKMHG